MIRVFRGVFVRKLMRYIGHVLLGSRSVERPEEAHNKTMVGFVPDQLHSKEPL